MKYTPPIMMDLNTGRFNAQGQGSLACVGGSTATVEGESCVPGTGAGMDCATGTVPYFPTQTTCTPGVSAGGDCAMGTNPSYNCVNGPTGYAANSCTVGPGAN